MTKLRRGAQFSFKSLLLSSNDFFVCVFPATQKLNALSPNDHFGPYEPKSFEDPNNKIKCRFQLFCFFVRTERAGERMRERIKRKGYI